MCQTLICIKVVQADGDLEEQLEAATNKTKLTEWFAANAAEPDGVEPAARSLRYGEFPKHFRWNVPAGNKWTRYKAGMRGTIGRIFVANPQEGERFHLRLNLLHVRGATSYEDVRTVNGTVTPKKRTGVLYPTFKDAARARGLLASDEQWRYVLEELSVSFGGRQLRQFFACILMHCTVSDPALLFDYFVEVPYSQRKAGAHGRLPACREEGGRNGRPDAEDAQYGPARHRRHAERPGAHAR